MAGPYVSSHEANYIGFGSQTAKGSVTAPTKFLRYLSGANMDHGLDITSHYEGGNGPYMSRTEKMHHAPSGQAESFCYPDLAAYVAARCIGLDTIGTAASGVYPHVITPDQTVRWNTTEISQLNDELVERLLDTVIFELTWSGSADNRFIRQQASFVGIQPSREASPTAESYEADDPFHWTEGTWTVNGGGVTNVTSFSTTFRWVLDDAIYTNAITRAYILKLRTEAELELQTLPTGTGEYREVQYGSASGSAVTNSAFNGSFVVDFARGSAGTVRGMKLEIPSADFTAASLTNLNPEGETVYLTRTATAKKATGSPLFRYTGQTLAATSYTA